MKTKTLLIIDDDKDFLDFIKISLEQNWIVLTASEGEQGIAMAQIQQPDLILLDLAMPLLDGLAVYKLLKSDSSSAAIPIIFVTAMVGMDRILKAKTDRNTEVITKHFNITKLETEILTAFNRSLASA